MFKFLKEKLANWAKKISKKESETRPSDAELKEESEQIEKPELEKELKKKADKIRGETHLGPSLDKQLRGETVGRGLKNLEEKPAEKKEGFFARLKSKISKAEITGGEFESYSEDLRTLLLENNVAFEVTEKIIVALRGMIVGKELLKKEVEQYIRDSLRDIIEEILIEPFDIVSRIREKQNEPSIILFVGINGTGKTTTIAKIADLLKKNDISCVMAAADTFRAASIEQIKAHGERLGIKVISQQYGADPASVGFDAISYARKNHIKCVLIDTAGRMHTAKNLMKEVEKIVHVCKPDLKIFIGESITGNDATEQAKTFNAAIGIDGIILAKADVDEKGGTALSVGHVTKKPIIFLGTGQNYKDLEPFDKRKFTEKLGL